MLRLIWLMVLLFYNCRVQRWFVRCLYVHCLCGRKCALVVERVWECDIEAHYEVAETNEHDAVERMLPSWVHSSWPRDVRGRSNARAMERKGRISSSSPSQHGRVLRASKNLSRLPLGKPVNFEVRRIFYVLTYFSCFLSLIYSLTIIMAIYCVHPLILWHAAKTK